MNENMLLKEMLDKLVPLPNWINTVDLKKFSDKKELWDYQQEALKNAIKMLWKYYNDFNGDKKKLYEWYEDWIKREKPNLKLKDLDINLKKEKSSLIKLLKEHFEIQNNKIPFYNYINRMCFWMATGSGKTLVIIKLIEIIIMLMKNEKIPKGNILFLTQRDDLIRQFINHLNEFNRNPDKRIFIFAKNLKEYSKEKRTPTLYGETIFYYRADNISDDEKENIIDFKNYLENGNWYVILDEAHKGDKEESKRQHIYSILSKNGFLFNFSATFVDERDIITTGFEYNLSSFISKGYGKCVLVLEQDLEAFKNKQKSNDFIKQNEDSKTSENKQDFDDFTKRKIVLKILILLTYIKLFYQKIRQTPEVLYHSPLLVVLVNTVNEELSDLKIFFKEIENIANGNFDNSLLQEAKKELTSELSKSPEYIYGKGNFILDTDRMEEIGYNEILQYVYNASGRGDIEISYRPSNRKEVLLKLKSSDRHFALIKTGDMPDWLKNELGRYQVNEQYQEESIFEKLNDIDSPINILIGSRSFYEGWDSNRPNIICFINIGSKDAKKFILQSIGRGVRIEPIKNERKRLLFLHNSSEIDPKIKDYVMPLETLFVIGTNANALNTVIKELKHEKRGERIELSKNQNVKTLLIPKYKETNQYIWEQSKIAKFVIHPDDFEILKKYINYIDDDRILLFKYNAEPKIIRKLREFVNKANEYYIMEKDIKTRYCMWKDENSVNLYNIDTMVRQILNYFSITQEEFENFKELSEEIKHFKNIIVYIEELGKLNELKKKIEIMKEYPRKSQENLSKLISNLRENLQLLDKPNSNFLKELAQNFQEETIELEENKTFEHKDGNLDIKYIAEHYYLPLLISRENKKAKYISHIIREESEIKFINNLENYLKDKNNKLEKFFDWWFFSKLDEKLDEIYIPYYDPQANALRQFKPDFIFWLAKGKHYFIVFVDPKSHVYTSYQYKVDGYKILFEENDKPKVFSYHYYCVRVFLFLNTDDENKITGPYKKYWFDNIDSMLDRLIEVCL